MRIYIAGSFVDQEALRPEADRLWKLGHEITGTWLQETKRPEGMPERMFKRKLAIKDLCEVARADLIIVDNRRSTGGKNAEMGFALGEFQHKQFWLVGEPTNVFQELADLFFRDWNDLITHMEVVNEVLPITRALGLPTGGDTQGVPHCEDTAGTGRPSQPYRPTTGEVGGLPARSFTARP